MDARVLLPVACVGLGVGVLLWRFWRGPWLPHPAVLFVPFQMILLVGTAMLVDARDPTHIRYLWILADSTLVYLAGLFAATLLWPVPLGRRETWRKMPLEGPPASPPLQDSIVWAILGVSVLVSIAYFVAVGYNLFVESVPRILSGGGALDDVDERRLAAYSGEEYFAPGFVNQFKNVLLPGLTAVVVVRYLLRGSQKYLYASLLLVPLSVVFLLGTGQRGAFVVATATAVIYLAVALPRRLARQALILALAGGLVLLGIATLALGRATDTAGDATGLDAAAKGIWLRVMRDNQVSGLAYHEYFEEDAPVWGLEWGNRLQNLLPGPGEKTADNVIHAVLYGTDRGTAPGTLWGSVWHNFAVVGALVVPLLLAMIHHSLYARLLAGPKSDIRVFVFVGSTTALAFWIVGGPENPIDAGLGALGILYLLTHPLVREFGLLVPRLGLHGSQIERAQGKK